MVYGRFCLADFVGRFFWPTFLADFCGRLLLADFCWPIVCPNIRPNFRQTKSVKILSTTRQTAGPDLKRPASSSSFRSNLSMTSAGLVSWFWSSSSSRVDGSAAASRARACDHGYLDFRDRIPRAFPTSSGHAYVNSEQI